MVAKLDLCALASLRSRHARSARLADVRVERAAEAAVAGHDQEEHVLLGARVPSSG